tara:strand:+ start:1105 stop:1326 length:222 start_codon:yes stop_codon:yes gene_type:complete
MESNHTKRAGRQWKAIEYMVVFFVVGIVAGDYMIPHFGHPSGRPNAAIGGLLGLVVGASIAAYVRLVHRRRSK